MRVLLILSVVFVSGCAAMKQPPPCHALQEHPCGEKRAVNSTSGDLW